MKWPVWSEVLGPTLLIGGLWLVVSTSTTIFMSWQDDEYQNLLTSNVAAVDAANDLQQEAWRVYQETLGLPVSDEVIDRPPPREVFDNAMYRIRRRIGPDEVPLVQRVEANCQAVLEAAKEAETSSDRSESGKRLAKLVTAISNDCHALIEINDQVIQARQEVFRRSIRVVLTIRQILNIAGPVVGIWLGYRAASKLRRQISRITVRLEGFDDDLGPVEVSASDPADLESLDQQVLRVQERLTEAVAELEDARREVRRNERLAAAGQLAAGVAHELRNPLTSVKLLVQTGFPHGNNPASGTKTTQEERERQFQVILDEIERMERTIQSLLDFARPPPQRRVKHDLRDTVRRVRNLLEARATQQNVTISYLNSEQQIIIDGDSGQLQQVLVNLLLNGIEAMPQGGHLTVELKSSSPCTDADGSISFCEVCVTDQGKGIPADVLEHLFEPFVTTKERGTGLGLAVSRRIVEEHCGELRVENLEGRGARFTLKLPCSH